MSVKKRSLLIVLLVTACAIKAMEGQTTVMSSQEVLTQNLEEIGLHDFAHETNLVVQLADKEKSPIEIVIAVNNSLSVYTKKVNPFTPQGNLRVKPIIQVLLLSHPTEFRKATIKHAKLITQFK